MPDLAQQQTAKLVLLGEMGSGKSSLVLRYVKGQFFDYQAGSSISSAQRPGRPRRGTSELSRRSVTLSCLACPSAGIDSGSSFPDKDSTRA